MPRAWPAALLLLALTAPAARAQVACAGPDDLCTGDPCVIGTVEVDDGCVLDFGPRVVVVAGTLRMPTNGELSITAGTIRITGRVQSLAGSGPPGLGPRITFDAAGDVEADGAIRLAGIRGAALPGTVTLRAGGALTARNGLTAATSPTTILYEAAGGSLDFGGRVNTSKPGGALAMIAAGDLVVTGSLRRQATVQLAAGGDVLLDGRLTPLAQASFTVDAGGSVTLDGTLRALGADVALRGATGVATRKTITLIPLFLDAGSLELSSSAGGIVTERPLHAIDVLVQAAGPVQLGALVSASPPARSGGTIVVEGASVETLGELRAQSGDGTQSGDGAGGHVRLAGDTVTVRRSVFVNAFPGRAGAPGGTVEIAATGDALLAGPLLVDADGDAPGSAFPGAPPAGLRVTSSAGAVAVLGAVVHARRGPSVVQLTAAGDVTATGEYRVAPNGCLGVSGGGTVSGPTDVDTPPVATCP